MRLALPFVALSIVSVLSLSAPAAAAKPALAGKSYVVNLTRDGQADGLDTLLFSEKTVDSRVAGALGLASAKYKGKEKDGVVLIEGKSKCVEGGKGRLEAEIRGTAITGRIVCEGKGGFTKTFQGALLGSVAPAAPQSSISPTVPGSETGAGAPANPAPAAPSGVAAPASPAPAAPATTAPAAKAPGAH